MLGVRRTGTKSMPKFWKRDGAVDAVSESKPVSTLVEHPTCLFVF